MIEIVVNCNFMDYFVSYIYEKDVVVLQCHMMLNLLKEAVRRKRLAAFCILSGSVYSTSGLSFHNSSGSNRLSVMVLAGLPYHIYQKEGSEDRC